MEKRGARVYAPTLVMLTGPPCCGKSTFALEASEGRLFRPIPTNAPVRILSPDGIIDEFTSGRYFSSGEGWSENVGRAWRLAWNRLGQWTREEGRSIVIFDAMFNSRMAREPVLGLLEGMRIPVIGIEFEFTLQELLARNAGRARRLPDKTIAEKFVRYEPPRMSEGFFSIIKAEDFVA